MRRHSSVAVSLVIFCLFPRYVASGPCRRWWTDFGAGQRLAEMMLVYGLERVQHGGDIGSRRGPPAKA
jgi:hypothetical protein